MFHWSFFAILAAMFVTRTFGFEGFALLIEGQTFVESPININRYDPGWFGDSAHRGFEVTLDDFDVRFRQDKSAADFVSSVTVVDEGQQVMKKEIRVNDPLDYRGVKLYQMNFGWAVRMVVQNDLGAKVYDDWVLTFPEGPRNTWTGVAKAPSLTPQAGFEVFLFPTMLEIDPGAAENTFDDQLGRFPLFARPGPPTADNPALLVAEYRGNLGADRPQSTGTLDKERLGDPVGWALVGLDANQMTFDDGLTVSFPEMKHYSVLKVKRDPGLWLALIAVVILLLGLTSSLYVTRRRLWIWVRPTADGTRTLITLGGLAYQRKDAFENEFRRLTQRSHAAVPEIAETQQDRPIEVSSSDE